MKALNRFLKHLSIKQKLIVLMMASSLVSIIVMTLLIMANQIDHDHKMMKEQLNALADILGANSTAALSFNDTKAGMETLSSLKQKPDILYATLKTPDGRIFAEYQNHTSARVSPQNNLKAFNLAFFNRPISVARTVYLENEVIGLIDITASRETLQHSLIDFLIVMLISALSCVLITFLFCTQWHNLISLPIVRLQQTIRTICLNKDYTHAVKNDESHEFKALIDSFNDMLEQIQIRENKLSRYNQDLENKISERTDQLYAANQKRLLWLETMAHFLRHELKNSWTGIKTSLDLIERRQQSHQDIAIYLQRARKSLNQMNHLLQNAGNASHLEADIYKQRHLPLNLSALIHKQTEIYHLIYPNLHFLIDCETQVLITGNEIYLLQLLDKLVSNAAEYTDYQTPIQIIVTQRSNQAVLQVKNTGTPLPSDPSSLFEIFVSHRPHSFENNDHYGLGLYLVKLIAEAHGGTAQAYPLTDKNGAIFEVILPLNRDSAPELQGKH